MSYLRFDREAVERVLLALDAELGRLGVRAKVVVVGSAALMLKWRLKRRTGDVDVFLASIASGVRLPKGIGEIFARHGVQLVPEAFLVLPDDYEERLERLEVAGVRNTELFVLGPYDLAVCKIARGFEKDLEDVVESGLAESLDLERLEALYREATSAAVGDPARFEHNWRRFVETLRKRCGLRPREGREENSESARQGGGVGPSP